MSVNGRLTLAQPTQSIGAKTLIFNDMLMPVVLFSLSPTLCSCVSRTRLYINIPMSQAQVHVHWFSTSSPVTTESVHVSPGGNKYCKRMGKRR